MSKMYDFKPADLLIDAGLDNTVLPAVSVAKDHMTIGGVSLSGNWIAQGGITITPGGPDDCNMVNVKFLVGAVQVDDSVVDQVKEAS